jgi:hypothetical protein
VLEVVSKINRFTENTTQHKKIIGKGTVYSSVKRKLKDISFSTFGIWDYSTPNSNFQTCEL